MRVVGEGRTIPVSAVVMGGFAVLTPLAAGLADLVPPAVVLVVGAVVVWACMVVFNVTQVSFRQRLCPPELLGRMNATVRFLVWGGMPIGALLGGVLGGTLGIVPTLWIAALGQLAAALPVALSPLSRMRDLPAPLEIIASSP